MIDKSTFTWPTGQKGAVSISYDDALPCHHNVVVPALRSHGLKVTFYVNLLQVGTTVSGIVLNPDAWREVAAEGHELGNHSIFHPCGGPAVWIPEHYDLRYYTPPRWRDEMRAANLTLSLLDGKSERTHGNTCAVTEIGMGDQKQSLDPLIEEQFVAGRGDSTSEVVDVGTVNYNSLGCYVGDRKNFETLKQEIDHAVYVGGWIIYMIHGVGENTHGAEYIEVDEHRKLLDYLGANQDSIWTAPVVTVARHLKSCDPDFGSPA